MIKRKVLIASSVAAIALLAFSLGPGGARGQSASFRVVGPGIAVAGGTIYLLDTSNVPAGWKALPANGITVPPVTVSSLAYYDEQVAITDAGEGWGKVGGVWTDLGPIPGLVPTVRESWGQLKAKYAR